MRYLASIVSPHVIQYKEAIFDEDSQNLYLIMEYLSGGDLFSKIKNIRKKNKNLEENIIWIYLI